MNNEKRDNELLSDGKRLTICIPSEMYAELCRRAEIEHMKVSVLVRVIFKEHFAKHKA